MKRILVFLVLLFLLSLLYFCELFIIWTHQKLYNKSIRLKKFHYLIPIITIVLCSVFLLASKLLSENFFSLIFLLVMTLLGYLIYTFLTSIIVRLIDIKFHLSIKLGLPLLYLIPFIISIYGLIQAKITHIESIDLTFNDYNSVTKILHLSDIHIGAIHQLTSVEKLINEIKQISPDIIVITGDMADGSIKVKPEWITPFNKIDVPILYIAGNHEDMYFKEDFISLLKQNTKIKHIGNCETFSYNGINFIGEDFGNDDKKCLSKVEQKEGVPNVFLSHMPNMKVEEIGKYNIFLFLAGHTHGGQMFPVHIFAYFANKCFRGLYADKDKKHFVYVSQGVNNSLVPMRVGSSSILAVISIHG